MFKQRLKHFSFGISVILAVLGTSFGMMTLLHIFRPSISYALHTKAAMWIAFIIMGVLVVAFIYHIFIGIWYFIQWLFIEPYRDYKRKKREESR